MKKKKAGFTLIEMIIVIALTVIILAITSSMFITGNKVFSDSDIKSTLQMEAQQIQEKISDIGMQGLNIEECKYGDSDISTIVYGEYSKENIKLVNVNGEEQGVRNWINIISLNIKSYDDTSETIKYKTIPISYDKANGTLSVNSKVISNKVKSIRICPGNITDENATIAQASSVEFNIVLKKQNGYITYPINFSTTFRNRT